MLHGLMSSVYEEGLVSVSLGAAYACGLGLRKDFECKRVRTN